MTKNIIFQNARFSNHHSEKLQELQKQEKGVIIISGIAGSGATTLISLIIRNLEENGKQKLKIATTESQSVGKAIKLIPDIIIHGNARNKEDYRVVLNAAETGHLGITSLTAESTGQVIRRICENPENAQTLKNSDFPKTFIQMRLVKKLCNSCKLEVNPKIGSDNQYDLELQKWIQSIPEKYSKGIRFANHNGCEHCNDGIEHRIPLIEIFNVSKEATELFANNKDAESKQSLLASNETALINEYALMLVLNGIVDPYDMPIDFKDTNAFENNEKRLQELYEIFKDVEITI